MRLAVTTVLLTICCSVNAQLFTELPLDLPSIEYSSCAVGDLDGDGDVDFVLTGRTAETFIYINEGNLNFVSRTNDPKIPAAEFGGLDLIDVDMDGDLDLVVGGRAVLNDYPLPNLYINDGAGNFTLYPTTLIYSGGFMGFDFGDSDNDGDLDLITGTNWYQNDADKTLELYRRHDGHIITNHVKAVSSGSVDWGDYDGDGDLDLLVVGDNERFPYESAAIYTQEQGQLRKDTVYQLPPVDLADAKWGDFNQDDLLDVAISGSSREGNITKIYKNNGRSLEEVAITNSEALFGTTLQWGDVDNDGLLDLVVTGSKGREDEFLVKILKNNNAQGFSEIQEVPGSYLGDLKLADFDSDGDLDFIVTGGAIRNQYGGIEGATRLYVNNTSLPPVVPSPPTNLSSEVSGDSVVLRWSNDSSSDALRRGAFYIVEVIRGLGEIVTTHIAYNLSTFIVGTQSVLKGLSDGQYRWRVKSVSNAFNESDFSPSATFYIGNPRPILSHSPQHMQLSRTSGNALLEVGNIGKGDITWTLVSSPDWLSVSETSGGNASTINVAYQENRGSVRTGKLVLAYGNDEVYEIEIGQDGTAIFEEWTDHGLSDVSSGTSAWGDVDKNGYYDWYMSGSTGYDYNHSSHLYMNQMLTLSGTTLPDLPALNYGNSKMLDLNNDGWIDFVVTGSQEDNTESVRVFRNTGNNQFEVLETPIPGFTFGSIAAQDFTNDGIPDIMVSGDLENVSGSATRLFIGTGEGFTLDSTFAVPSQERSTISPADFDNDGDLDVFITNYGFLINEGGTFTVDSSNNIGGGAFVDDGSAADIDGDGWVDLFSEGTIYQNLGSFNFQRIVGDGIDDDFQDPRWGDIDADGDLDFVGAFPYPSNVLVYENQGDFTFKLLSSENIAEYGEARANIPDLVDIDRDGKLDVAYTSNNVCCLKERVRVFLNKHSKVNTAPSAPTGLSDSVYLETAYLEWGRGADAETLSPALTYNLSVKDANGSFVVHPNSHNLKLLVPERGFISSNRWNVVFPKPGRYTWSVQTVDNGLLVSDYSLEKEVELFSQLILEKRIAEYQAGKVATFHWKSAFVDSVRFYLDAEDNEIDSAKDSPKQYSWLVPFDIQPGVHMLYIQDVSSELEDSLHITIFPPLEITYPSENAFQQVNRNLEITWKSNNIDSVSIEYALASDSNWITIEKSILNKNVYAWAIPVIEPGEYLIKVANQDSSSTDTVRIVLQPYLELTQPSVDSVYYKDAEMLIAWEKHFVESVRVDYQDQPGGAWRNIVSTDQSSYSWQIPQYLYSDSLRISVLDLSSGATDTSNYVFFNPLALDIENHWVDEIKIYPNPFDSRLHIVGLPEDRIKSLSVYSLNGSLVKDFSKLENLNGYLSELSEKVYLLQVILEDRVITKRLIKQKYP